jgi:hypothetical protein
MASKVITATAGPQQSLLTQFKMWFRWQKPRLLLSCWDYAKGIVLVTTNVTPGCDVPQSMGTRST